MKLQLKNSKNGIELIAESEEGIRVSQNLLGDFDIADQADKTLKNIQDSLSKLGQTMCKI